MGSLGEGLIGALVGAFVGSVFGYLFSYRLAQQTRRQDLEDRRKRLMRALSHELAAQVPVRPHEPNGDQITVWSGIHLATLEPLLDLVADLPDEGLLQALAAFQANVTNFNDAIVSVNALQIEGAVSSPEHLWQNMDAAFDYANRIYDEARADAKRVLGLLEVRA